VILLARHGETEDNRPPLRFQGRRDSPLNAAGRRQAAELAERLRARGNVAALYTSDLMRARQTAEAVGRAVGLEPVVDARFSEGDRGRWEGRLMEDVEREEPERYAAWRRAGAGFRFPGGESLADVQSRVLAALADVERRGAEPAVVVCHGGPIRAVLCARDPRGLDAFHAFEVPNVAVIAL
jgi:broad specificity phosphatase PhoE